MENFPRRARWLDKSPSRRGVRAVVLALCSGLVPTTSGAQAGGMEVYAEFASTIGPAGVREVRLYVDGADVTDAASISDDRVSYRPAVALAAGVHEAEVVVVDTLGRRHAKSWTFGEGPEAVPPELRIAFDVLPRQVTRAMLLVSGTAPPDTEIDLRVNGVPATRTTSSSAGRFTARVDLDRGFNEVSAQAEPRGSSEAGPEAAVRVELRLPADSPDGGSAAPVPVHRGDDVPGRLPPQELPPGDMVTRDPGAPKDPVGEEPPRQQPAPPLRRLDPLTPERTGDAGQRPVDPFETRVPDVPESPARVDAPPRGGNPPPRGSDGPAEAELPPLAVEEPGAGEPPIAGELVITKPSDGDDVRAEHVTVLGRAPARWRVVVLVNGRSRGSDQANPAGHFTMPKVALEAGDNELVAEATSPDGTQSLTSEAVRVVRGEDLFGSATDLALTSPARPTTVSRTGTLAVEGTAWEGAEIEVEVNGRIAATGFAGASGRFSVPTPLEAGSNHVLVEALDARTGRSSRSRLLSVTSTTAVMRKFDQPIVTQPPPRRGVGDRKPVPPTGMSPR